MTPQEAITQVSALTIQLIDRVKDGETAELLRQIRSLNRTIHAGYFAAEQKAIDRQQELSDMNQRMAKMMGEHPKTIEALKVAHRLEIDGLTKHLKKS